MSAFLLFPTMPLRILALGGTKSEAGLFLGFLTYASAFFAPVGGALADRIGKRPVLLISCAAILSFVLIYASTRSLTLILVTALPHGAFWSGLMAASAALISDTIPPSRRAEGIGFWGFASILAIAVAPRSVLDTVFPGGTADPAALPLTREREGHGFHEIKSTGL